MSLLKPFQISIIKSFLVYIAKGILVTVFVSNCLSINVKFPKAHLDLLQGFLSFLTDEWDDLV